MRTSRRTAATSSPAPRKNAPVADPVRIDVPRGAGQSTWWGEALPVRPAPASKDIVLNLSALSFVDPFFMLRLRGFLDYHASRGHMVEVVRPKSDEVCRYLAHGGDPRPRRALPV